MGDDKTESKIDDQGVSSISQALSKSSTVTLTSERSISQTPGKQDYAPNEEWRMLKNLIMIGSAFAIFFTAFQAITNLQSSVNAEGNLGLYALACLYGSFLVSNLFVPPFFLAKLGAKWTLAGSIPGYLTYIGAQFYPSFGTLIPASLFIGFTAAGLWASSSNYVTTIADEYALLKGKSADVVSQWFFGFFFLCFQSAQVWGNLMSSFVLSNEANTLAGVTDYSQCGSKACPGKQLPMSPIVSNASNMSSLLGSDHTSASAPAQSHLTMLFGVALALTFLAAVVIIFGVDSLKRYGENTGNYAGKWYSLLTVTANQWKDPKQLLLIPLTAWVGIQEAFIEAEFTLSFVACSLGIDQIGYVMSCYGASAAICSLLLIRVSTILGRWGQPLTLILASLLNAACFLTMLCWTPNPEQKYVMYIIAVLWGIASGGWSPQVRTIYGTIFAKTREAAFSNAGLWLCIGYIIVYISASLLCMAVKIYIYLVLLVLTLSTYLILEFKFR